MNPIRSRIKDYTDTATRMKYIYARAMSKYQVKKNLILFESFHGRDLSDSPFYIMKELLAMPDGGKYDIYFATSNYHKHIEDVKKLGINVKLVDIHSDEYAKVLATAEYLVNNSSFPSYFIKREGQHYLQTWHGTPLKTLGKKMRMGMESMHNVQHNFLQADLLQHPNEFTRDAMMNDYNLRDLFTGKIALTGYPRNSVFSDRTRGQEIKELLGNENIKTIAYMPTWRGQNNYEISTKEYGDTVGEILTRLDDVLDDSKILYVNFHPLVQDVVSLDNYKHILPFPDGVDKYEFLNSTDALITDYSSVFFDYSITGKPIILFMYDYDEYMADRGMYLDIKELPFTKVYDLSQLCQLISSNQYLECSYAKNEEYVNRFIRYDSIDNAKQLCRLFFYGEDEGIHIDDYSTNKNREWNIVNAEHVKNARALNVVMDSIDPDKDILVLAKRNFNSSLSSYMYDNHLNDCNYIFTVRSVPRTYGEDMAQSFSKSVKKRVHGRDLARYFNNLNIVSERKAKTTVAAGDLLEVKTRGTTFAMKARLRPNIKPTAVQDVILIYRSDVEELKYSFDYEVNGKILDAYIDFANKNLDGIYWDVLVIYDDGEEQLLNLDLGKKLKKKMRTGNIQCVIGEYIMFPHISVAGQLAFTHRELSTYDNNLTRAKETIARIIYKLFRRRINNMGIWLVFEKFCSMAQDNGYYFFKFCMEQLPDKEKKNIYYVMKPDADDWDKVSCYGNNVVKFMSIKHMVFAMAAEVLVGSDSKKHLYQWRARPNMISQRLKKKKILFLQHGVTALKRVDGIFGAYGSSPMTYFTTTSEYEQKIVVDNFGYAPEDAPILGFTRWDVLEDTSREDDKLILVMPTWRSWLEEKSSEEFKKSDYYENYMKLFTDPKLGELLEKYNARMIFYIHPKFKDYLGEFVIDNDRIELVPFGSRPLNAIMRECRMLITDYSSVCWDVYYMGKPVMFYQFDYDMYMETHGSYMDMTSELFGERYFHSTEVINGLEKNLDANFTEDEKAASMRDYYFKYIDNNNCRRTYEYLRNKGC